MAKRIAVSKQNNKHHMNLLGYDPIGNLDFIVPI